MDPSGQQAYERVRRLQDRKFQQTEGRRSILFMDRVRRVTV